MQTHGLVALMLTTPAPVLVIGLAALIGCGVLLRHARARAASARRPTAGGRLTRPRRAILPLAGLALAVLGITWGLPDWHWGPGTRTDHWEIGAGPDDYQWHRPAVWAGGGSAGSEWTTPRNFGAGGGLAGDAWNTPTGGGGSNGGRRPNPNDWR